MLVERHLGPPAEDAAARTGGRGGVRQSYCFALLPDFCLLSLTAALETLRVLNEALSGREVRWTLCAAGGAPMRSSAGIVLPVEGDLPEAGRGSTIVIVGGENPPPRTTPVQSTRLEHWIRRCARRGARVAALHSGSLTLARAGLLANRSATVHWRYMETLAESHPDVELHHTACVVHDDVMTSSGGTSAIDLFLRLAETDFGAGIAREVAEHFSWQPIRTFHETRPAGLVQRRGIRHRLVADAVAMMEAHAEEPLEVGRIAGGLGLSTRQIERLFRRHLGETPKRYYTRIRLERAHRLLCFSDLAVTETAMACGFASVSHFSRLFRAAFGVSPHRLRAGAPPAEPGDETLRERTAGWN